VSQETIESTVLRFIQEQHLISPGQKLVVAVSGGPDSVCLLHVLLSLREELDIKLHVAHLDHQLRGSESEADARYVAGLAQQLGIPATIERSDVKSYRSRKHGSLEEAAREVRYAFLSRVARSVGASTVAVGHTLDDHIETILLHLIRGTGTRGLRGLAPGNRWQMGGDSINVIRPLLPVSRDETNRYCQQHRITTRLDTSNLSLDLLRNRVRHRLLPLLGEYNPRIADALLRTARIVADDIAVLDSEVSRLLPDIARKQNGIYILDRKRFDSLPAALKRNLLRALLEELRGSLKDIEQRHIEEIMDVLEKPAGKRLTLPFGLTFAIEYDRYLLGCDLDALCPFPDLAGESSLKVPGETSLSGWRIEATVLDRGPEMESANHLLSACFDLDKTGDKLVVRSRRPGDTFQPLGMNQPKKLNEFMIDARIPQSWRKRVPIVCSPTQILWVAGWHIDNRVKVTPSTRHILSLKFEKI
jgi:tRNA(Ile)-lysidine synthase